MISFFHLDIQLFIECQFCFTDVTKKVQELYALINYGEMRKKISVDSQKFYMKLRELVYRGSVTCRVKGKNCRIKTPSCTALRKINQVESELCVCHSDRVLYFSILESLARFCHDSYDFMEYIFIFVSSIFSYFLFFPICINCH